MNSDSYDEEPVFEEEEDEINDEGNTEEEDNEEESAQEDLVVIDDDLIDQITESLQDPTPAAISQAIDTILGFLELKHTLIVDESTEKNPLEGVLTSLLIALASTFSDSKPGSKKRAAVVKLIQTLTKALEAVDKFKHSFETFDNYCTMVEEFKDFIKPKTLMKAVSSAIHIGMLKSALRQRTFTLIKNLGEDEELREACVQIQYTEFLSAVDGNHDNAITELLDNIIENMTSESFIKSIFEKNAANQIEAMKKSNKAIISWKSYASMVFLTRYVINNNCDYLAHHLIDMLFIYLKHFSINFSFVFQIRCAYLIKDLMKKFELFTPLLSWIVDAFSFVCNTSCKGNTKFIWETTITTPPTLTFEFCEESMEKLSKLFFEIVVAQSTQISFPEFIHPIIKRIESLIQTSKNGRMKEKLKPVLNPLKEQQKVLNEMKKDLSWNTRGEQLSLWTELVEAKGTPLKAAVEKREKFEETLKRMKPEIKVDGTGDLIEVATVDDV